ncbi:CPBP family intramembrane metalloprotease [bacterium]|nr:CPBP family intramembrane metalloprotease [candidate division CSSED10-310 bacterium]
MPDTPSSTDHVLPGEISLSRSGLWIFIGGSAAGFTVLTWLIETVLLKKPFSALFESNTGWIMQSAIGLVLGASVSGISMILMRHCRFLNPLNRLTMDLYRMIRPGALEIVVIAMAAGWGEELFFRGMLQKYSGILLASFVFASGHTGLRFRSRPFLYYFIAIFLVGIALGYMRRHIGLAAAMWAHAAWDTIVLIRYRILDRNLPESSEAG